MSTMIRLPTTTTPEQMALITRNLPPDDRLRLLLEAANARTGQLYRDLTSEMNAINESSFATAPMFIGGDPTDIEVFVSEVWRRPVTDANYKAVAQLFKVWFALTAPDAYHDPIPSLSLWEAGYRPGGRTPNE